MASKIVYIHPLDERDELHPYDLVLYLEQVDLISVVCNVRVPPVLKAWLLGQGNNHAQINIVGEIDEF
jgi:hypothetical protein